MLRYQIALSLLYEKRNRVALRALAEFGSAEEVWRHISEKGMGKAMERAEKEAEFVEQHRIATYWCEDEGYPMRLRQCPDRPLMLFGKGNLQLDGGKFVSVVGTRNATERGKEQTRQLVLDLAERVPNLTIISGLAYGIDIVAHRAAIEAGIPTLIIPGHGLDRIYPALHRNVAVAALEHGGLLTEYPSGSRPDPWHFIARDRIIAGMADAVVVVESKEKGGALITAQMALDYDRELFASPGRPTDEYSAGCNQLIRRQKAHLLSCADELIEEMGWETGARQPLQTEMVDLFVELTDSQRIILDKLHEDEEGMHINSIVIETGMNYAQVSADLMMMEMQGIAKSLPGGIVRAVK